MAYRNKPVVVEAFQYGVVDKSVIPLWAVVANRCGKLHFWNQYGGNAQWAEIISLDGVVTRAEIGDYITCDVNGVICSCNPDLFNQSYELIVEGA